MVAGLRGIPAASSSLPLPMDQNRRGMGTLVPRQASVKRTSVSSDSSMKWIDSFVKREVASRASARRRVSANLRSASLLPPDANYMVDFDVSSASSPEPDYFPGTGHEFMGIESADTESTLFGATDQPIYELPSIPSSQNAADPTDEICELSQGDETTHLSFRPFYDGSELDYCERFRCDPIASPYMDLTHRAHHDRHCKDSLAYRLHLLTRRSFSDRSIWLHQYSLNNSSNTSDRIVRVFRVLECYRSQKSGVPGLVPFRALELHPLEHEPPEQSDATAVDSQSGVILLLPVSGKHTGTQQSPQSILGDTIHVGDVLRIFSPWSVLPGRTKEELTVLYQFFWVQRVHPRELHGWMELSAIPNDSSLTELGALQLSCSCLAYGTRSAIHACANRFRAACESDEEIERIYSKPLDLDQLQNPVLVLGVYRFWLASKLRDFLLSIHYSSGYGLVILPMSRKTSPALPLNQPTHFNVGSLYETAGLLRIPGSQVPDGLQHITKERISELQRHLPTSCLQKFAQFCSKLGAIAETNASSFGPFCLWDARSAKFHLVETNYFIGPKLVTFHEELKPFNRCHIRGTLICETSEGSLIKDEELHTLKSLEQTSCRFDTTGAICPIYAQNNVTRVMYILVEFATGPRVVPCFCLSDVQSALNLLRHQQEIGSTSEYILSSSTLWSYPITVDDAVSGVGCVFVDHFTKLRVDVQTRRVGTSRWSTRADSLLLTPRYMRLDSVDQLRQLSPHQFIRFEGIINRVSTSRSHTWPLCNHCYSSDLVPIQCGTEKLQKADPISLRCRRCSNALDELLQLFEVEVGIQLETKQSQGLTDPFHMRSDTPLLNLNMSPKRMFALLGLAANEFSKDMHFNPRTLLYKRVDDARGLVIHVERDLPLAGQASSIKRILVLELD
ncbi:hypothetical protein CRM22_010712 [Opisthorchis felineus]|uniref:DUF4503 domain-containing protein n=2 Tax=Opisthorchis felineus TaxID=147828 RepID=A0A4V3SB95_OPIFE|nr:hypothetical protein CRM22_010712 [Opisthorchis felineus]